MFPFVSHQCPYSSSHAKVGARPAVFAGACTKRTWWSSPVKAPTADTSLHWSNNILGSINAFNKFLEPRPRFGTWKARTSSLPLVANIFVSPCGRTISGLQDPLQERAKSSSWSSRITGVRTHGLPLTFSCLALYYVPIHANM
jgi:hypothetical protein